MDRDAYLGRLPVFFFFFLHRKKNVPFSDILIEDMERKHIHREFGDPHRYTTLLLRLIFLSLSLLAEFNIPKRR